MQGEQARIIKYPRGLEIELTRNEAVELFYALKERIENAIKRHWITYPDSFLDMQSVSLQMLKELSKIVGFSYETEILPGLMSMLKKPKEDKL